MPKKLLNRNRQDRPVRDSKLDVYTLLYYACSFKSMGGLPKRRSHPVRPCDQCSRLDLGAGLGPTAG